MKIALVHELLTMRGGAERVLRVLADLFPDAPIYTLLYDEKKLGDWFPRSRIRTSRLQRFAWLSKNHHLYLPFFPSAVEAWDFSDYDLVLSTSSAFAHGIITNGKPMHISYVHSPARYLWDRTHDVQRQSARGILGPIKRWYLSSLFHKLRIWDSEVADRADVLIAASEEVQRRIELYWRRESHVIYPPIDDEWLAHRAVSDQSFETLNGRSAIRYYAIVSTLARYKRIEIAIEACNALKVPLKIAGEGPDRKRLQKLAGATVEFLGYQSHDQLKNLYQNARATLFPGEEDFGLVPLESMACGTPVIAYGKGGALETVVEGETGVFFSEPTAQSLAQAIERCRTLTFDPVVCRARAKEFSRERFEENIRTSTANLCAAATPRRGGEA